MRLWSSTAIFMTFAVVSLASPQLNHQWEAWKAKFHKVYPHELEAVYRRAVWEKNWRLVRRHNVEAAAGRQSFTLGLNQLADMTAEEVNQNLNRLMEEDPASWGNRTSNARGEGRRHSPLPESVDWREMGLVTPVQSQGQCGSCWAFSAVGSLEGQMKKKMGDLVPLSPQDLMDCSFEDGNKGCNGGLVSKAFQYVIRNKGIDSWSFYPYEEQVGQCRYSEKGRAGYCVSFRTVPSGDEDALQAAVATVGPVSVSINASLPSFHHYQGGVYNPPDCSSDYTNHAVVVVGYGTDQGQKYWLVKNSWGAAWGEQGYIRMARNKNLCAIAKRPIYPTVDD